jgi:hypothetical protein
MTNRIQGEKYDETLDVAQIAKKVRKDIAEAMRGGRLPKMTVSVRISRYSMGQSIDVTLAGAPQPIFNPDRLRSGHAHVDGRALPIYNDYGRDILEHVEAIVAAYNYDNSDSQSDYYDTNFGGDVRFETNWQVARRELEVSWLSMADEPPAAPDTIPAPAMAANDTILPPPKPHMVLRADCCPCKQ